MLLKRLLAIVVLVTPTVSAVRVDAAPDQKGWNNLATLNVGAPITVVRSGGLKNVRGTLVSFDESNLNVRVSKKEVRTVPRERVRAVEVLNKGRLAGRALAAGGLGWLLGALLSHAIEEESSVKSEVERKMAPTNMVAAGAVVTGVIVAVVARPRTVYRSVDAEAGTTVGWVSSPSLENATTGVTHDARAADTVDPAAQLVPSTLDEPTWQNLRRGLPASLRGSNGHRD